jgi:hypothetical protein
MCDAGSVAGGMGGRRDSLSMRERVALTTPRGSGGPGCPARHCWVAEPADGAAEKRAGLLVEWRQTANRRWQGRVVYLAHLRPGLWSLVEEWVDDALLTPT